MITITRIPVWNPTQHCTADDCDFKGLSHTAQWCLTPQTRLCGCRFCCPIGD